MENTEMELETVEDGLRAPEATLLEEQSAQPAEVVEEAAEIPAEQTEVSVESSDDIAPVQPAAEPVKKEKAAGRFARKPETAAAGTGLEKAKTVYGKIKQVIGLIVMILYHLRKVFMAAPVVYYALKIARYNMEHLPEVVGLNLQANGEFAMEISRQLAVVGPLAITGGCLALMFLCRKAMYSWAISIFTLIVPIVLLISNQYPA